MHYIWDWNPDKQIWFIWTEPAPHDHLKKDANLIIKSGSIYTSFLEKTFTEIWDYNNFSKFYEIELDNWPYFTNKVCKDKYTNDRLTDKYLYEIYNIFHTTPQRQYFNEGIDNPMVKEFIRKNIFLFEQYPLPNPKKDKFKKLYWLEREKFYSWNLIFEWRKDYIKKALWKKPPKLIIFTGYADKNNFLEEYRSELGFNTKDIFTNNKWRTILQNCYDLDIILLSIWWHPSMIETWDPLNIINWAYDALRDHNVLTLLWI